MTILATTQGLQLQRVLRLLTLRPFDVSTPEGRSQERYRRMLLTAITGAAARGVGFLNFLITVPLTLGYLGRERYGAWMAISSLMAFLSFSDLGLSNGLISAISRAEGAGDRMFARRAISSVVLFIVCFATLLLVGFYLSTLFVRWDAVLGLAQLQDHREIRLAILAFVTLFAVGLPINLSQHVQSSLQRGFVSNLWMVLASVLSLSLVWLAAHRHAPIYVLVLIVGGAPTLMQLANAVLLFGWQRPDLRPSFALFDRDVARQMLQSGMLFLGLGVAGALAYDSQNVVIAHVLGPAAVGTYAVVQRLYSTIPMVIAFVTQPLWPAFGDAIARQEWPWVRRALQRGVLLNAVIAVVPAVALSLFSRPLIAHWTHGAIEAPFGLVAGFSLWAVISAISSPMCMLLNAAQVLTFQLVSSLLFGVSTVIGMALALHAFGLSGGVWTMLSLYVAMQLIPYCFYLRRFFRQRLVPANHALQDQPA